MERRKQAAKKEYETWLTTTPEGKRTNWVYKRMESGYRYAPHEMLETVYEVCKDAPKGSELYNIKKMFEEGKIPAGENEYKKFENMKVADSPLLVTYYQIKIAEQLLLYADGDKATR